jgi:FPC/CPF motif-containing protein YcgG
MPCPRVGLRSFELKAPIGLLFAFLLPEGNMLEHLNPFYSSFTSYPETFDQQVETEFKRFVSQPNYPCIAARVALAKKEYLIRTFSGLGTGRASLELGHALLDFKNRYQNSNQKYLSLIAVFDDPDFRDEEEFEQAMWRELSVMASLPEFDAPWDPNFSSNPEDKNFCFSLGGSAYFVVGLHPGSSRKSRRFFKPALVFNLYEQFEALDEETEFYPMVKTNRKRDIAFQGEVNPMVEQHAEKWEAIQFSGKQNPPEWKCPFQRLKRALQS